MAEWFNATVLKTVESKAPGVRIPLPPFRNRKRFSGRAVLPPALERCTKQLSGDKLGVRKEWANASVAEDDHPLRILQ
jgi:hypothetical protein